MSNTKPDKPLGQKNYGSIGHLPESNIGHGDHTVNAGEARICKTGRNKAGRPYRVIVEEKYDGTNAGIAKVDGAMVALQRSGYPAASSPYDQHQWFAAWVRERRQMFDDLLDEGERLAGEWMAVAHGTKYHVGRYPFVVFDILRDGHDRLLRDAFWERLDGVDIPTPDLFFDDEGDGVAPDDAYERLLTWSRITKAPLVDDDRPEGLVYRVERNSEVCFLAKWVWEGFEPGIYLPGIGRPDDVDPILNDGVDPDEWRATP